jgi:hypothetical protein
LARGIKRVKELVEKESTIHQKHQALENKKLLTLATDNSRFGTVYSPKKEVVTRK